MAFLSGWRCSSLCCMASHVSPDAPVARISRAPRLVTLAVLGALCVGVLLWKRELVSFDAPFDPLLAGLWAVMAILATQCRSVQRDVVVVGVALVGGFAIEAWGTQTGLWSYYSDERPPLWIIPAWPAAALATERLGRPLARWVGRARVSVQRAAYRTVAGAFVLAMAVFIGPTFVSPVSWGVIVVMALLAMSAGGSQTKLARFFAGAAFGYGLEYWGTTRGCWTYYTGEEPPVLAAFAHGFASVAFAEGAYWLNVVLRRVAAIWASHKTPKTMLATGQKAEYR